MLDHLAADVLIVAAHEQVARALSVGLGDLGWFTITATDPGSALAVIEDLDIKIVIIDMASNDPGQLSLPEKLRAACHPRILPILGLSPPATLREAHSFDLILATPAEALQLDFRIGPMVRMAMAKEELGLRLTTLARLGGAMSELPRVSERGCVLSVGEPGPQVLSLANRLREQGLDVISALTPNSAFDYLHGRTFDAVVIWGGQDDPAALSLARGVRRNSQIYHTPIILMTTERSSDDLKIAYGLGVSDVASPECPVDETAHRILELARSFRDLRVTQDQLSRALGDQDILPWTTFSTHMETLTQAAGERMRPLSVCILRLADGRASDLALTNALDQAGSMIRRLIRIEDCMARLDATSFAVLMPATPTDYARIAGERIRSVLACAAFDGAAGKGHVVLDFKVGVAGISNGETVAASLNRAAEDAQAS